MTSVAAIEVRELGVQGHEESVAPMYGKFVAHFLDVAARRADKDGWTKRQRQLFSIAKAEAFYHLGSEWRENNVYSLVNEAQTKKIFALGTNSGQACGALEYIFLLGRAINNQISEEDRAKLYGKITYQLKERVLFNFAALIPSNESYNEQAIDDICKMALDKGINSRKVKIPSIKPQPRVTV